MTQNKTDSINIDNPRARAVRPAQWPVMALQQLSDSKQRLQLDLSLCRLSGELGKAMRCAFELGDRQLYEQLRNQRLQISELRDRFLQDQES